ncbi:LysR family transcriptional regulator [Siminovitchia terrae]|uniref:LysR family transcriptional regulator n=1 Tax=Siminovitchia terrae TaxID=1914933 RepID=A0A429X7Q5_SIMTE|nr:LysR family transcriptional regulator [Siminovitchia terrae]RST59466.1 LysR family transcriptional regulator [Siminovitchia terrae]GIN90703.1 LysR family transcriptional regulator [Siminovitchia terrae]GIN96822.1 LysR family transcriptional regulator [Siminovitchia terrae]
MDQQLAVFIAVAEKKNFSRAAEELHMTQPAVSQYIQAFEREVGTRLLERTNKYVKLNKAGEVVYDHAKEIIGLYTKMQRLVDDLTNKTSGPLAIGASYTFGEYILPHVIANMLEDHPLVTPTISIGNTRDIAELVSKHQMDVGIVEGDFQHDKLVIEPFAEDNMFIVAAPDHRLAKMKKVIPQDLEEERWIVREVGSGTRKAADNMFESLKISPEHLMEFGSIQLIKESVEAGLGISLLSQWAINKELSAGTLKKVQVDALPFTRKFSIVTSSPYRTKALDTFLEFVRKVSSEGA